METLIRVILLDDHPLVMEGLKNRLEKEADIQVAATLADPRQLLGRIEADKPDVLVMDISMPHLDGFELAGEVRKRYGASVKIVLLSGYMYDEFLQKAYDIGVHAYLSKQTTYSGIINAIRQSMAGHVLIPEKALPRLKQDRLTRAERTVLLYIAQEKTNKEIAEMLRLSQRTVESHITSLTGKLGIKSRVGAVAKGYELGLLGAAQADLDEETKKGEW